MGRKMQRLESGGVEQLAPGHPWILAQESGCPGLAGCCPAWWAEDLGLISHFTSVSISTTSSLCCDDAEVLPSLWAGWLRVQLEIISVILGQMGSALCKLKCKFLPSLPPLPHSLLWLWQYGKGEFESLKVWAGKTMLSTLFPTLTGEKQKLKVDKTSPSSFPPPPHILTHPHHSLRSSNDHGRKRLSVLFFTDSVQQLLFVNPHKHTIH